MPTLVAGRMRIFSAHVLSSAQPENFTQITQSGKWACKSSPGRAGGFLSIIWLNNTISPFSAARANWAPSSFDSSDQPSLHSADAIATCATNPRHERRFCGHSPAIVINATGYTKVDLAEREEAACMRVNGEAVENLAKICQELDALLVQISTDYVFGGDEQRRQPYREDDPPSPQSVYARSKVAGEQAAATWKKHLIVRTCGLYGPRSKPTQTNFVDTILRLGASGTACEWLMTSTARQARFKTSPLPQYSWHVTAIAALTTSSTLVRLLGINLPVKPCAWRVMRLISNPSRQPNTAHQLLAPPTACWILESTA